MPPDRHRLQSLVDDLPDSEVQVAISFLAELGAQEIIDSETVGKLDQARTEAGDVPRSESYESRTIRAWTTRSSRARSRTAAGRKTTRRITARADVELLAAARFDPCPRH